MWKTTTQRIKRTPYQALAAILIMTLAFIIIGVFAVTATGMEVVLRFFESRPQITVFLKDEIKPQQVELLKSKLESSSFVKKVKYVSKEEALGIYREENKDNPLLLEMVSSKILPASLEISASSLENLPEIAAQVKTDPLVEEVIFQEDVVANLSRWMKVLRKGGLLLVMFSVLISILSVLVVISMKISGKKEEIEILGLVGASGWYIRGPFILEGIVYGLVSGFFSFLMTWLLLLYSTPFLVNFLAGIPVFPVSWEFIGLLLLGLVVLGVLVGGLGGFWATKRFLRLKK